MAEAVLSHIAGDLIKKLGSRVVQEIGMCWNVKDELNKLKNTLDKIQKLLLDAEKQSHSGEVREWLGKLKEAVYDADDLLDDFSTGILQPQVMAENKLMKKVRTFFSSSNKLAYGLNIGHKIEEIREKLDEIAAEGNFDFKRKERRSTHSYVCGEDVIGRDEDKKEIIKTLSNAEESILVVPIVGIGGLGKTTLAQLVYNDRTVQKDYELRMWVCVSDHFDVKLIMKKMIKSATNEDPENLGMDQLENRLQEEIHDKKYLLVLDDVWNEDKDRWLHLENLLRVCKKESRIIVTTRSIMVAEVVSAFPPFVLESLSENDAWALFKRITFRQREELENQSAVEIGKRIVSKCVGIPLVIKTMGNLLFHEDPENDWSVIENEKLSNITQHGDIFSTLELSYDYLPSHLKNCFAYCKLFPRNYDIHVPSLINLWISQGFIESSHQNQSLEDIGFKYFRDLLCRFFFQEVIENQWGEITYCKMNNLMHELAERVGGTESDLLTSSDESLCERTRHVSFDFQIGSSSQIPSFFFQKNKIRTFFMPSQERWKIDEECLSESNCNSIVLNSRRLRILDLHYLNLVTIPNSIAELKLLRYLDLSHNQELETLPNSITKLQNLQVLKLLDCYKLKNLSPKLKNVVSLRCLQIWGCNRLTCMPRGIGRLSFLHRLDRFIVDNRDGLNWKPGAGLSELKGLNNLRGNLCIENLGYLKDGGKECGAANLKGKQHLQSLQLLWNRNGDDDSEVVDQEKSMTRLEPHHNLKELNVSWYKGDKFPSWLSSLTNLVHLHLYNCRNCKDLPTLGGLTCLQSLVIKDASSMEYTEQNDDTGGKGQGDKPFYPSLKILVLRNCPHLKGWWSGKNNNENETDLPSFPCLSRLEILQCPKLTSMPSFPSIEGDLRWEGNSWKPLQETMGCSTPSFRFPLSKLESLSLIRIEDIESLPEEGLRNLVSLRSLQIQNCPNLNTLPGEGLRNLSSLRSLQIQNCPKLTTLPGEGLRNLTSLQSLEIVCCPKIIRLPGEGFRGLTCLRSLSIENCECLYSLVGVFEHLTALEKLVISSCEELDLSDLDDMQCQGLHSLSSLTIRGLPKLESFPESIQHVVSLQELEIHSCRRLKSLPDGMVCLTSLKKLKIFNCPQLSKTCRKHTGSDWRNIDHIPRITIDFRKIQRL